MRIDRLLVGSHRGVSTTIGVVLLVGLTITTAVVLGGLVAVAPVEPAPTAVVVSDGSLAADAPGDEDQQVCLRNRGPEAVAIGALRIGVRVPRADRRATLVGLPPEWPALSPDEYRGDDLVDRRAYEFTGAFAPTDRDSPRWRATEEGCFRIKQGGDGVRLEGGDRVSTTVVHEPSNAVLGRIDQRAR